MNDGHDSYDQYYAPNGPCQGGKVKKDEKNKNLFNVPIKLLVNEEMRADIEDIAWKKRMNMNEFIREVIQEKIEKEKRKDS